MLVPMRMELEGLSAREAVDAVLRENLHGLELDQRCVELAAFALALTGLALSWCRGLPAAARIASGLLGPIGQCGERRVAAVGAGQTQPTPCSGMDV